MKSKNILFLILIILNSVFAAAGFGWIKTTIEIRRKIPPFIKEKGSVSIQMKSVDLEYDWLNATLKRRLSQEIIENNPNLKIKEGESDFTITLKILRYYIDQKWNPVEVKKTVEVECEEENYGKGKKKCNKEIKEIQMYLFALGELEIECEIIDNRGKRILYDNSFLSRYEEKFILGSKTPSLREIERIIEEDLLMKLSPIFSYTEEIIKIPLAKGKDGELKEGNEYAKDWRWQEAIKQWKSAKIDSNDPESKSNRLYNFAIAEECQAYYQKDKNIMIYQLKESLKYLEEAIRIYPKEKIYYQAQDRIKSYIRLLKQ